MGTGSDVASSVLRVAAALMVPGAIGEHMEQQATAEQERLAHEARAAEARVTQEQQAQDRRIALEAERARKPIVMVIITTPEVNHHRSPGALR